MSEEQTGDPVPELLHMILLVDAAVGEVQKALKSNPSTEQERSLHRAHSRLEVERTLLVAEFDAALAGDASVDGPSDGQMLQIVRLTEQVEGAAADEASVSARIALAGRVLDLATDVLRVS